MSRRPWGMALALLLIGVVCAGALDRGAANAGTSPTTQPDADRTITALTPADCSDWRYGPADEPASLPPEFDRNDYKRTSLRDPRPELHDSPQNQCGQKGSAVDLAWGRTRGSADVVIAVLDSGIKWRDAGAMQDLATKVRIDLGEAPPPCFPAVDDGDCNGDGTFDITDFGSITDRNANGLADPEDLILDPAYSNGVDDDHDGYVDDIAGWDFLYGDNDPFDTVSYGHGTGEALDSTAAENGTGDVGTCPGCKVLPVRVSDSFIADGGRFAAGVLFGLDQGAAVIQEALGAISNPVQAQQAIDAAYDRDVVVVASMADEASRHPNLPASLEHTMAVNSVTEKQIDLLATPVEGYLALNGCTNFGGHTFVSVPSSSCSSEATGISAGIVGLAESRARDLGVDLSANEMMQLVRASADDIDFSTPNAVDPPNNFGTPTGNPLIDTVRYPSRAGWDSIHGYGRINAYELVRAIEAERIPPEAMIDAPSWFAVLPASGTVSVTGSVAAPRAESYDYRVEWAPGVQPPAFPEADTWTTVATESGLTAPRTGTLATLDLGTIAAALPDGATGSPVDPTDDDRPDEERFSVRLRVVVTAHGGAGDGLQGEMQKQVFVHDDPDLVTGFPWHVESAGTASPVFVDLDGDGTTEMVLGTDDGTVHAYHADLTEAPGFPVRTPASPWWPAGSATAAADGIAVHHAGVTIGGPAVGDVDGDGALDVVATDLDGGVSVWSRAGSLEASMRVDPAYSQDSASAQDQYNRSKPTFASAPALGDLDGDGVLDIVAAALDRHLYAWQGDGTPIAGYPVLVVDPAKVASIDPTSHRVTFTADSEAREGGELVATPTLADLAGDGRVEVVIGAQEEYVEPPNIGDGAAVLGLLGATGTAGNSRAYAFDSDGTLLPGWPTKVAMLQTELLPTIGDGVAMPAAIADVDPSHPGPEILVGSAAGPLYVFDASGHSIYGVGPDGRDIPVAWSAGLGLEDTARFGADRNSDDLVASLLGFGGPSFGDVDADGTPDVLAPTAGLTRLIDLLAPDLQLPNDDQLSAWNGTTGRGLPGSPQAVADLGFFVAPAVADLDGDGINESIAATSSYTVSAFDGAGHAPAGWPKLTGGWAVGTPGIGDWDGDGTLEVAVPRRDGTLFVWRTAGRQPASWSAWGCDATHAGSCRTTLDEEPPPESTTTSTAPTSSSTQAAPDESDQLAATETTSGSLPVTGRDLLLIALVGAAFVACGLLLRRSAKR